MHRLFPHLPLVVVSEFPVTGVRWIPYRVGRSFRENLAFFRWFFRGQRIRLCAVILQPRVPYRRMRLIALLLAPRNFLAFNENFGHFMLRPRSLLPIVRHMVWRTRNFLVSEFSPGGASYTFFYGLVHPDVFRRPFRTLWANVGGIVVGTLKAILPPQAPVPHPAQARPCGISVVIPSRNGKELLAMVLPETLRQIAEDGGEVIVIDNGSDDGTAEFLSQAYPRVILESGPRPLSFARAVNVGIRKSRFSHVCLLNNDMVIEEGFFRALTLAFDQVPGLFCATAQIFFPQGARREETGKAIIPFMKERRPTDFPIRCDLPLPGEDLSYVLYGSGGCSLFDGAKMRALRGMDEVYEPAYVEDLDLGFRAWQRGWPSVFVARAHATHQHRATLSRYYSRSFLDCVVELHYLIFLTRAITSARIFWRQWREAVRRLDFIYGAHSTPGALYALNAAWGAPFWLQRGARTTLPDDHILALCSGAVAVFPGRLRHADRPLVLIATPYLPFPLAHGGAVRMFNLMRRAAGDFDQVLVTFTEQPGEVPEELLSICCEVVLVKRHGTHLLSSTRRPEVVEEFDSPSYHAALRQTVHKWKPSLAQLEYTQMGQYAEDCLPAKTILVEHDITLDLYHQLLAQGDDWEVRHQLERWIPFEKWAWSQVDRVVTMSEKDSKITLAAGVSPKRTVCLPNGVDLERYQPVEGDAERRRLLFIGSFAHLPNLLAMDFFLREVWPRLRTAGSTMHIIAGQRSQLYLERYQDRIHLDLAQPGLELEDFVPDVRPAYSRAAVVVAPLLASAGTNIKIMEAMAMGKAVVSTPAGVSGLDLESGKDVIVASTGAEISQAILELFDDPAKRYRIEHQARRTVENRFGWDAIARKQKHLYEELGAHLTDTH
jgi:GT2 family glycosyltransferase/glycosyltransferase involved in cell wall biosynthesis